MNFISTARKVQSGLITHDELSSILNSGMYIFKICMLDFISKIINKIKNKFYSTEGYYFLKTGLYFDHYCKKIVDKVFKEMIYYTGVVFTDFYLLKKFINNFFINLSKPFNYLLNFKNKNNLFTLKTIVFIIICTIFLYYISI